MKPLAIKDFSNLRISPDWSPFRILLEVAIVAAQKHEEEDPIAESSRIEKLIKEKILKKPMTELKPQKKKARNGGEKLMKSAIESLARTAKRKSEVKKYEEAIGVKKMKSSNNGEEDRDMSMDHIEKKKQSQKKSSSRFSRNNGPYPPPGLPEEFETEIINRRGGTEITRVIQKALYATDVEKNNGRISIPLSQVETLDFLREDEIKKLDDQSPISIPLIHKPTQNGVPLNQPALIETPVDFRQWHMRKGSVYVLKTSWNEVARQNELKEGDVIQIWAYRRDEDKLCMALVVLERGKQTQKSIRSKHSKPTEQNNEGSSNSNGSAEADNSNY